MNTESVGRGLDFGIGSTLEEGIGQYAILEPIGYHLTTI